MVRETVVLLVRPPGPVEVVVRDVVVVVRPPAVVVVRPAVVVVVRPAVVVVVRPAVVVVCPAVDVVVWPAAEAPPGFTELEGALAGALTLGADFFWACAVAVRHPGTIRATTASKQTYLITRTARLGTAFSLLNYILRIGGALGSSRSPLTGRQ